MALDAHCAALLARTYRHTVSAWRSVSGEGETLLFEDQPCALSRAAHTSAPTPPQGGILPESAYRLALYTLPAVAFALGDRVEVYDETGTVYRGRTSDSFRYPSHCVTVVEISEVQAKTAGRNSHETDPAGEGETV